MVSFLTQGVGKSRFTVVSETQFILVLISYCVIYLYYFRMNNCKTTLATRPTPHPAPCTLRKEQITWPRLCERRGVCLWLEESQQILRRRWHLVWALENKVDVGRGSKGGDGAEGPLRQEEGVGGICQGAVVKGRAFLLLPIPCSFNKIYRAPAVCLFLSSGALLWSESHKSRDSVYDVQSSPPLHARHPSQSRGGCLRPRWPVRAVLSPGQVDL